MPGEHLKFQGAGGYIQIDIPKYDAIKFSDMDIGFALPRGLGQDETGFQTTNPELTFRAYSMANHPAEGNIIMPATIRIASRRSTVPRDLHEGESGHLLCRTSSLAPGDKVTISGPYGEFFSPDDLPDTQELDLHRRRRRMAPQHLHHAPVQD